MGYSNWETLRIIIGRKWNQKIPKDVEGKAREMEEEMKTGHTVKFH